MFLWIIVFFQQSGYNPVAEKTNSKHSLQGVSQNKDILALLIYLLNFIFVINLLLLVF